MDPRVGYLLVAGAVILAIIGLTLSSISLSDQYERLRHRLLWGIPWGTVVCVVLLLVIYYFVQRGWWHGGRPVIVAFTASSLFDPTGWLFAGFSHSSPGHLRGNLITLLVFGPIVEYFWGHYPPKVRHRLEPTWARNPWIRAFVLFPLGVGVIGILAALFSWGPVIGFSVGAYALIGCALVRYPLLTVVGIVARETVRELYRFIADPVVISETVVRAVRPSWYGTAVQGHLLGLLLGVIVGIALLRYRDERPPLAVLWICAVFVGIAMSVWELWWIIGPEQFILFRGAGIALVIAVATLIAVAVSRPESLHVSMSVPLRRIAVIVLIVTVAFMGVASLGINLAVVEAPDEPVALTVEDYDIYYGENIPDGMVNIVDIEAFGLTTDVQTSGVVVVSEDRNVWRQTLSAAQLQNRGHRAFTVGGIGWSQDVEAFRSGWVPVGNETVYQVWFRADGDWKHAYASDPRTAEPVVANHTFTIEAIEGAYALSVEYNDEIERIGVPPVNESVTVGDVIIHHTDDRLVVEENATTVTIAERETFE